jgi:1,2-dihydroxy-3-keto-5-methylthiopentene dioxygenase
MSRLVVHDANSGERLSVTEDAEEIARTLAAIGVRFERWPVADLPPGRPPDARPSAEGRDPRQVPLRAYA